MSDRYTFSDQVHEPERPSKELTDKWQAELAQERHLIDDSDPQRLDRWRVELAGVLLGYGIPVRRAGELASALLVRMQEPL